MPLPKEKTHYTYADYLSWDDDERVELIYGNIFVMESPNIPHQRILGKLFRQIDEFLDDKPCEAFVAPLDVRLFEKDGDSPDDVDTIVQPDIMVVCDHNKLENIKSCKGAPDFIIEILSPSNFRHDMIVKLNLYNKAGVREYWIADPESKTIQVFLRNADGVLCVSEAYSSTDTIKVNVLQGCTIDLGKVFPETEQ